jgi:hypothetical protein
MELSVLYLTDNLQIDVDHSLWGLIMLSLASQFRRFMHPSEHDLYREPKTYERDCSGLTTRFVGAEVGNFWMTGYTEVTLLLDPLAG